MKQQFKHKTSGELYHIGKDQKQGTNLINSITGSEYFLPGYYEQKDVDELFTPVKETEQFFNGDLQMDAEKHLRTDNFEIKKDEAENDGELMYYLDVNDDSYFYHNESDRDFDYARAKRLFTKSPTPTSKEGLEDRGFTPGEWEASYNSEEFPGQAAIYGCDGDTNGRVIAVLDTSDQTDMANIDLICAAPIMYDLLKWVVNEIETTPDELSDALLGMIKIKCNQLFTRINKD